MGDQLVLWPLWKCCKWAADHDSKMYCFGSCGGVVVEVLLAVLLCPPTRRAVDTQLCQRLLVRLHTIHFDRTGDELWFVICTWISERVVDVLLTFCSSKFVAKVFGPCLRTFALAHPVAMTFHGTKGICSSGVRCLYRVGFA